MMSNAVTLRQGNIYLHADFYAKYFSGLNSVAILKHEQGVILMPLQNDSGGGLLLKIMNAKGDRVIHAREALESFGVDEAKEYCIDAVWITEMAGLYLPLVKA